MGCGHQRPADLDQPALAEAEALDRLVGEVGEAEQLEHLVAARRSRRAAGRPRPTRSFHSRPSPRADALGDQQVLAHGRVGEQLDALEGAADAAPRPRVHRQAADVLAVELDRAAVGAQHAEHAVEERGLAGAVRADEPDPLALVDLEVDVVEGDDAGEALA